MDVFGRYVTAKGEMMEEFLISDAHGRGSRRYPAMAISPKNDSVFILWEDNREKTSTKHRQRIFSRVRSLN